MTRRSFVFTAAAAAMAAPTRSRMGIATTSFMTFRKPRVTLEFLEYTHSLGAGGIQAPLSTVDPAYGRKVRERAEQLGMFVEVIGPMPKEDASAFERMVVAAKEAGARCVRCACLGGRRYETFKDLATWQQFVTESKAAIERAIPIVEKHRVALALENHKDWTVDEMLALMQNYRSEYLGVCLDTGNNIALLDDPYAVVEGLAPYAISTHIKDMAWEPYEKGFLMSEVPLGEGFLDMRRIVETVRKARPKTNMTLEMITRNPLQVPCLEDRYWATFPDRDGLYLARTIRMVGSITRKRSLPTMESLSREAQLRLEEDNVKQSLHYARMQLGL